MDVICDAPGEELRALAADTPHGAISIAARAWQAADFAGAAVAVGAMTDDAEAENFAAAARRAGFPSISPTARLSDFIMGAIVNRSPLVIGVSTGGAAPVFAQAVRGRIETLIPRELRRLGARGEELAHAEVLASGLDFLARRDFWRRFTRLAFAQIERAPTDADRDALLAQTRAGGDAPSRGRVTLVGAGPGDPELLTLKGLRVLAGADVVLFDDLVPASVLDFARREATRINVGKRGYSPFGAAGGNHRFAGEARQRGQECRAAQGRRSDDFRPRQ